MRKETFQIPHIKARLILFCVFISLVVLPVFPQTESPAAAGIFSTSNNLYQWGVISSFHGLPSERVNTIAQTRDGVLWFGTEKGLARFDGRRVQTITAQNLSILRILTLRVDPDDTLWIGTESGAFRVVGEVFTPVAETAEQSINSIFISAANERVYLSSEKGMIFESKIKDKELVSTTMILNEDLEIKSLTLMDSELLIGTNKRGTLKLTDDKTEEVFNKPRPFYVNTFERDADDNLWIGAEAIIENSGLYFARNLLNWEKIDAAVGSVSSISFDGNRNMWLGTRDRGAYQFKDKKQIRRFTFENTAGGLRSNTILSTFVDRENVIWFGTDKGVCRYDPNTPNNDKISEDVQSNYIRTFYKTRTGRLLAGTNRGLFLQNNAKIWRVVSGFNQNAVYSIAEDSRGNLLIGTSNGFHYNVDIKGGPAPEYSFNNSSDPDFSENIRSIRQFQGKTYLAFFGRGLARFDRGDIILDLPKGEIEQIISLHPDNENRLWIGTANNGVFAFDGHQIKQYPQLDRLKNIAVWTITGTLETGLWFGTEEGLFLLQNNILEEVLPDTDVRDVRLVENTDPDRLSIWCATVNGLTQIIHDDNFAWIISRIDVEQGLPSQSTFSIIPTSDKNEQLLIGTNRGIVRYNLDGIKPLLIPTRVLSKRLHQMSELETGIDLEYPQTSLAVEVAGLSSRTFPEQFQYLFLLRDQDGKVINKKLSNESQFLMENLAAGFYQVEIRAFDKNLTASDPLVFTFSIASAPFPLTTIALTVLLSLAVIALIWAIRSQRRISRASSELAFANRELNSARLDLANEAERERRRISRDLHDQTLADLRHLLLLTDKLPVTNDSAEKAGIFRAEIENVSNEIRNICEDLSPSVLENIGFTAALEWALNSAVQDSKQIITYDFECDESIEEKIEFSPTVQIQIYRIAQEILSNIVQHSGATYIKMSLEKTSNNFILKIVDNSAGFDVSKIQTVKSRGLANIRARANLIDAQVAWSPRQTPGMNFTLTKY